jgi:hypothetical protein
LTTNKRRKSAGRIKAFGQQDDITVLTVRREVQVVAA